MIKSTSTRIDLDKIRIPVNFENSIPATEKIAARLNFYKKNADFDRQIIIDEHNNLIDGYTTYLVCKMLDIKKVHVLRLTLKMDEALFDMLKKKLFEDCECY